MPLLRLGFRPLYLSAATFSISCVLAWVIHVIGLTPTWSTIDLPWHMHEMLFGFALAIVAGFLLTAARNWTGLWTPRGQQLAAIVAIWAAGRVAMLCLPAVLAACMDLLFIPCIAWPLFQVMKKSGNKRNLPLIGILGLLMLANLCFHAIRAGWLKLSIMAPIHAAILILVTLEALIGGRVIPGFTANAVPGSKPVQRAWLDSLSMSFLIAASLAWLTPLPSICSATLAFAAASAQGLRLYGWQPWKTLRVPLMWILHLSYAWIVFGFILLGMAELGLATSSTAFHALAIGSMASLMMGMITRTALGHTGRLLKAGKMETAMYLLLQSGAVARLCANLNIELPGIAYRNMMLLIAGACWSASFVLYLVTYTPYLCQARLDGREG